MELSELSAYAEKKYQIKEQYKFKSFPTFSVLCHPETGKWVALIMRQWDYEQGEEIERCDIKCDPRILSTVNKPYVSHAIRMNRQHWIDIAFDGRTEPETVYHLLDLAIASGNPGSKTIVLDKPERAGEKEESFYHDTPLPFIQTTAQTSSLNEQVSKRLRENRTSYSQPYSQTYSGALPEDVPAKIREMIDLDTYRGNPLVHRAELFYRQGKFMEDYEDNKPWHGHFKKYYTTYRDLNVRQLRGYFTWRTQVRKGNYQPIDTSLAYIYIYELLCGIGTTSAEDSFHKMENFESSFLDPGYGNSQMRTNLHRWMFEFAVLKDLPQTVARKYANPVVLKRDKALAILKNPKQHDDEEVFSSLCLFAGDTLGKSCVLKKAGTKGTRLFAEVWRCLSDRYTVDGKDIFTACFGKRKFYVWHPLSNAVYWEEHTSQDRYYELDECRSYRLKNGKWWSEAYEHLFFDLEKFQGIFHEADRVFRQKLKTGHYLRPRLDEAWATPYAMAAFKTERQAEAEAARPKITIHYQALDQIRRDSLITRDSLLTEEEKAESEESAPEIPSSGTKDTQPDESSGGETFEGLDAAEGLDALHLKILKNLLDDQPVEELIEKKHLMPSVVADTINEAFLDDIGDSILECDGATIHLVEDYKVDVEEILGDIN